jgi:hypothetical protein
MLLLIRDKHTAAVSQSGLFKSSGVQPQPGLLGQHADSPCVSAAAAAAAAATQTLLFKPVDGQPFLKVDQADLPDLKRRMAARHPSISEWTGTFVPAGYTMYGQLVSTVPHDRQTLRRHTRHSNKPEVPD